MANPFLRPYIHGDIVIKTRTRNLFWVLTGSIIGFATLSLSLLSWDDLLLLILVGSMTLTFAFCLFLLRRGNYRSAANITLAVMALVAAAASFLNRSGAMEADLFQSLAFFGLALALTGTFGYTWHLAMLVGLVGVATQLGILFTPFRGLQLAEALYRFNQEQNPIAVIVILVMTGTVGTFNLQQTIWLLGQMKKAQETVEAHAQALEGIVLERTASLQNILDNSGQGFFTFGDDFRVDPQFSRSCGIFFKDGVAGHRADELLFPHGGDAAEEFVQGLGLYFAGKSKASVIFDLLEKETFIDGRYLAIDYRESAAHKILCVVTDVTLDKQLADKNRLEAERQALILRAVNNKHYFAAFLDEATALFDKLLGFEVTYPRKAEIEALLRQVHTFKGNAGFFSFLATQEMAHDFEFALSDSLVLGGEIPFKDFTIDLKKSYYHELNTIADIMGREWINEAGGVVMPRDVYDKMAKFVRHRLPHERKLIAYIDHYRRISLKELFSPFTFMAQSTADKLGKRINPLRIEGGDVRVLPEPLEPLVEACVHLVNNMIDHGIEYSYDREANMKEAAGNLLIRLDKGPNGLMLLFKDDGKGISVSEVERLCVERGLIAPDVRLSPPEILAYLFHDGFSTRTEVSNVSGRGVGLAAVKEEVTRLGGTIEIHTKPGFGTEFEILIPMALVK